MMIIHEDEHLDISESFSSSMAHIESSIVLVPRWLKMQLNLSHRLAISMLNSSPRRVPRAAPSPRARQDTVDGGALSEYRKVLDRKFSDLETCVFIPWHDMADMADMADTGNALCHCAANKSDMTIQNKSESPAKKRNTQASSVGCLREKCLDLFGGIGQASHVQ
jgi:hypothetical protein